MLKVPWSPDKFICPVLAIPTSSRLIELAEDLKNFMEVYLFVFGHKDAQPLISTSPDVGSPALKVRMLLHYLAHCCYGNR